MMHKLCNIYDDRLTGTPGTPRGPSLPVSPGGPLGPGGPGGPGGPACPWSPWTPINKTNVNIFKQSSITKKKGCSRSHAYKKRSKYSNWLTSQSMYITNCSYLSHTGQPVTCWVIISRLLPYLNRGIISWCRSRDDLWEAGR